jgi:hypothetical protein
MGNCGLACEVDGGGREMVYSKTNQKEALGSSKCLSEEFLNHMNHM